MKKLSVILIFLVCILAIKLEVKATEELSQEPETQELLDITNDIEIKYKWYKEERVEGTYHQKGVVIRGFQEDTTIFKQGRLLTGTEEMCRNVQNYLNVVATTTYTYSMIPEIKYIELSTSIDSENIKIYHKGKLVDYEIISEENNKVKIDLINEYLPGEIWFYIKYSEPYEIKLISTNEVKSVTLSKYIENQEIIVPDKSWINGEEQGLMRNTKVKYEENDFVTLKNQRTVCEGTEILTYRYKIKKVYYDDNYHTYVEGYTKDIDDFIILYKGTPITNTVEVTKLIKEKEIEYVQLEPEKIIVKEEVPIIEEKIVTETEYKTEYIEKEKEVKVIPKYIYIIIFFLVLTIIICTIKILKKKVD